MKCPYCNKEIGDSKKCPYCYAEVEVKEPKKKSTKEK